MNKGESTKESDRSTSKLSALPTNLSLLHKQSPSQLARFSDSDMEKIFRNRYGTVIGAMKENPTIIYSSPLNESRIPKSTTPFEVLMEQSITDVN